LKKEEGEAMKNMIITVLSKPEVAKIKFSFGAISINSTSFRNVKNAVTTGKITVSYNAKLGAGRATYRYTHNTLFAGFKATAGIADREALLVHECTHAASDIAGKKMLVKESEAAAYIAQCLYFYYKNEKAIKAGATPTFKNNILKSTWSIAMKAVGNSSLSAADVKPLMDAISKHPLYLKRHSAKVIYDGI